jgi:S-adenosylmethionine hydrolase
VAAFNLAEGSYLLAQAARVYPPGTVFAADGDPSVGEDERSIVLLTEAGKLFVGPDNRLFTDVMNDLGINSVWEITNHNLPGRESASANFKGIGIRGPVASHLAAGSIPPQLGPRSSNRSESISAKVLGRRLGKYPPETRRPFS